VKRITIIAALLLAIACKVEKTGNDTYKVVAPKKTAPPGSSPTETTSTTATTTDGTTVTTEKVTKKRH
jgi:hypothetical protein